MSISIHHCGSATLEFFHFIFIATLKNISNILLPIHPCIQ